jgi:DtxR family Mn-dependent transcriptional regulator
VEPDVVALSSLEPGQTATVTRVPEDDGALLRYLDDLGLRPGQEVKLVGAEPFSGPLTVCVHGQTRLLGHELGERIGVTLQEDSHE